jgi:hypothetical protein
MNTATLEQPRWTVGRGQHVQIACRGFRRRTVDAIVVSGALANDAAARPEFELVIALPDATDRPITISSGTVRSMRLTSEGVFQQRGRQPSMWLKVWAELDLSDVRQLTGHGTVTVSADLNLNPAVPAV